MKKFIDLAKHIIVMENDAYLSGHPEWNEFVKEAKTAIEERRNSYKKVLHKDNQDNYDMGLITTKDYYDIKLKINQT